MVSQPLFRQFVGELLADSAATPLPSFTPRRVPGKTTAVYGVRRAGKTTYMHQLRAERVELGTPIERLPYVSFEDERLADIKSAQLGTLIEEFDRRSTEPGGDSTVTWFFDEIQVIDGWETFV